MGLASQQYAWRPGYWYPAKPDWVWSPDSYQSTPSGYVYNQGFWDYSLPRRGLPFAPVAFNNFGGGPGGPGGFGGGPLSFTPSLVLPVTGLLANLFVRPNYGHYYFGDYYNSAGLGANAGYVPWFGFRNNRIGYDPIYSSMAALKPGVPTGISVTATTTATGSSTRRPGRSRLRRATQLHRAAPGAGRRCPQPGVRRTAPPVG